MARNPSKNPASNPYTSANRDTPPDDDLSSIEPPIEDVPPPDKDWNPQRTIDGKESPGAFKRANNPDLPWDAQSLALALGSVHPGVLPQADRTEKGFSKVQPVTANNVHAALAYLGMRVRVNLMDCSLDVVAPERIDYSRFGTLFDSDRNNMLIDAFCDAVTPAGLRERNAVKKALARLATSDRFHPAQHWIESVPWDGIDRFQPLLDTITTDTPDLLKTYLRRWLLQGVEAACGWAVRAKEPKGLVLVLAGKQGIGKTRWLMALAPEFSQDGKHLALNGTNARDSKHEALRAWITELGELEVTFKRADIALIKGFITSPVDVYRLPYGETWTERPRCTSFCGSVNDDEFLVDTTGNRRFCPVRVTACNPDHGIDMQQLWAQVWTWWKAGEQWWLTPDEERLQTTSNTDFQQTDGIEEAIEGELARRGDRTVYTLECAVGAHNMCRLIGVPFSQGVIVGRVSNAMTKHLGKSQNLRKRGGVQRAWIVWLDPEEAKSLQLESLRPLKD